MTEFLNAIDVQATRNFWNGESRKIPNKYQAPNTKRITEYRKATGLESICDSEDGAVKSMFSNGQFAFFTTEFSDEGIAVIMDTA